MSKIARQLKELQTEAAKAAAETLRLKRSLPATPLRLEMVALTQTLGKVADRLPRDTFRARARMEGL